MGDIAQRGNRLTFAKGGRAGHAIGSIVKRAARKFRKPPGVFKKGKKTHGKDIPTMAAEGGRIGLQDGSKRFVKGTKREKQISMAKDRPTEGTKLILHKGTKPYTPEGGRIGKAHGMSAGKAIRRITERLGGGEEGKPHSTKKGRIASGVRRIKRGLSARQRDKWGDLPPWRRDSKAKGGRAGHLAGGAVQGIGNILKKKFKKKKVYPETEDLTHQKGPYVGDVGSEGKKGRPKAGKGKSPGPKGRRPWGRTLDRSKK